MGADLASRQPQAMLAPELQHINKGRGAAGKLYETIERIPSIDSASPEGLKPDSCEGNITLENVVFHYPSRPDVPILQAPGLSLHFQHGTANALVGASGSGKSTVAALVMRFYDPVSGRVLLDGRDIKTLNVNWLRRQIGLVQQEPTLFGRSVRGNIETGLIGSRFEKCTPEEKFELVKEACVKANAHEFIMQLPQGYDTECGERGELRCLDACNSSIAADVHGGTRYAVVWWAETESCYRPSHHLRPQNLDS